MPNGRIAFTHGLFKTSGVGCTGCKLGSALSVCPRVADIDMLVARRSLDFYLRCMVSRCGSQTEYQLPAISVGYDIELPSAEGVRE